MLQPLLMLRELRTGLQVLLVEEGIDEKSSVTISSSVIRALSMLLQP